ncbi:MAG: DMT family transporter [Promethearchaeota archaeon]
MENRDETNNRSTNFHGILYALVVLFGNGIHPIINNSRPNELNGFLFVLLISFWEFITSTSISLLGKYSKKKGNLHQQPPTSIHPPINHKKNIGILIGVGIIFSVATYLYVEGLINAGAVSGSIALKASPIYAFIIGALFFKERPKFGQIFFTSIILVGIYYLGTEGTWQMDAFSLWFGLLLLVPLLWVIGHSFTKPLLEKGQVTTLRVIQIRSGIITTILLIISLFLFGFQEVISVFLSWNAFVSSFLMGFIYFLMHYSWYNSIRAISIAYASALVTPSPLITALFAWMFLNEPLLPYHFIGLLITIIGLNGLIWINSRKVRKIKNELETELELSPEIKSKIPKF